MSKASNAGKEVLNLSNKTASKFDGYSTPINFKSYDSIKRKTNNDYNGDINKVYDSVRTTIIIDPKNKDNILDYINKNSNFIRVKVQTPDKFMGYSGVITNVKTSAGVIGEIQINTEGMIYAKETPVVAKSIIGEKRWNSIREKTGLEGGLGHDYYEKWRVLNPITDIEKRKELEKLSKEYYKHFR